MNLKPVLVDDLGSGFRGGLATDPGPPSCWRWALQPGRNQAWFGPPEQAPKPVSGGRPLN